MLTWDTFSDHLRSTCADLHTDESLWDLRLVSEDGVEFSAHKIILSAGSPVLRRVLSRRTRKYVTKGIQSQELRSILQFMYLGKTDISEDRIEQFLKVARDLELPATKELVDSLEIKREDDEKEEKSEHFNDFESENSVDMKDINTLPSHSVEEGNEDENDWKKFKTEHNITSQSSRESGQEIPDEKLNCGVCEKEFTSENDLKTHKKFVHGRVKYWCNQCDKSDESSFPHSV